MNFSSLNPLSRVNSILIKYDCNDCSPLFGDESQSPKSGQFNSDKKMKKINEITTKKSQSPKSGQFNSDELLAKKGV